MENTLLRMSLGAALATMVFLAFSQTELPLREEE
jgi:hypothetical protein